MPSNPAKPITPLLNWISGNIPFAVSAVGGFLYLIVEVGYRLALRPFGVTPAEVGVDYVRSIFGTLPFILMMIGSCSLFVILDAWMAHRYVEPQPARGRTFLVLSLLVILFSFASAVSVEEWQYVRVVSQGRAYEPLLAHMSPLTLRADSVQVEWTEPGATKASLPSGRLLLFGVANDIAVILEVDTFRIWRLPVGDLIIVTQALSEAKVRQQPKK
jgi:hypothetical protein